MGRNPCLQRSLRALLHDKERLGEWHATVPDFEPYEAGSEQKVRKVPR